MQYDVVIVGAGASGDLPENFAIKLKQLEPKLNFSTTVNWQRYRIFLKKLYFRKKELKLVLFHGIYLSGNVLETISSLDELLPDFRKRSRCAPGMLKLKFFC